MVAVFGTEFLSVAMVGMLPGDENTWVVVGDAHLHSDLQRRVGTSYVPPSQTAA